MIEIRDTFGAISIDYDKELAEYFNVSIEEIQKRRKQYNFDIEWEKKNIKDGKEANKFYAETLANIFRQAQPREKRLVLYRRILKYILATQMARELNLLYSENEYGGKLFSPYTKNKILDYGCGIGDIGLMLSMLGYDVDLLEIGNSEAEKFLRWRFEKRYLPCNFISYGQPLRGVSYDIVICIDVLEHHEKPREALMDMTDALKKNGYLFLQYGWHERENYPILDDLKANKKFIEPFLQKNYVCNDKGHFWFSKR